MYNLDFVYYVNVKIYWSSAGHSGTCKANLGYTRVQAPAIPHCKMLSLTKQNITNYWSVLHCEWIYKVFFVHNFLRQFYKQKSIRGWGLSSEVRVLASWVQGRVQSLVPKKKKKKSVSIRKMSIEVFHYSHSLIFKILSLATNVIGCFPWSR